MQPKNKNKASAKNEIPAILYGQETAKALTNFTISELTMPRAFIWAIGELKAVCAQTNNQLGLLSSDKSIAIQDAAHEVAQGFHDK